MSSGKHFQLVVPNYDQSGAAQGSPPLSYLRLGKAFQSDEASILSAPALRGDDMVYDTTNGHLAFKDDWRSPTYPDTVWVFDDGVTREDRAREVQSQQLLSRGGWREHTDGNRISTTRGDCVEVIQGNYKLIVLGRVATGWDPSGLGAATGDGAGLGRTRQEIASGGHYNDSTSWPGEMMNITWHENEDGTWRTVTQTDHGDLKSIYKGWLHEQYFGPSIISKIGVATEAYPLEQAKPAGAVNTTTAAAHTAQKPDITEVTYARSEDVEEHIATLNATTTIRGGGTHTSKTHVETSLVQKETADTWLDVFGAVALSEHAIATTISERDAFSSWRNNFTIGGIDMGVALVGVDYTARRGIRCALRFASTIDIAFKGASLSLAVPILELKVRVGTVLDVWTGTNTSVDVLKIEIQLAKVWAKLAGDEKKVVQAEANGGAANLQALNLEGA